MNKSADSEVQSAMNRGRSPGSNGPLMNPKTSKEVKALMLISRALSQFENEAQIRIVKAAMVLTEKLQ